MKYNLKSINMMNWAKTLFPINRSLTGKGVKQTISFAQKKINKKFKSLKIKSNTKVFDWKVPYEWNISKAYIDEIDGKRICDFKDNNLHIVGYSKNIKKIMSFRKLKHKIH